MVEAKLDQVNHLLMQLVGYLLLDEQLLSYPFVVVDLASMVPLVVGPASLVPFEVDLASMEEVSLASFVAKSDPYVDGLGHDHPYHALDHEGDRGDPQRLASDDQHENVPDHVRPYRVMDRVRDRDVQQEELILSAR